MIFKLVTSVSIVAICHFALCQAVPSVQLSSTTDYVTQYELFNLSCAISGFDAASQRYRVQFALSLTRVSPVYTTLGEYVVDGKKKGCARHN